MKKVDVLIIGPDSFLPSEFFVIKKFEEVIMPDIFDVFPNRLRGRVLKAAVNAFKMMEDLRKIEIKAFNEMAFHSFVTGKNLAHSKGNGFFSSRIDLNNRLLSSSRGPKYRWKK